MDTTSTSVTGSRGHPVLCMCNLSVDICRIFLSHLSSHSLAYISVSLLRRYRVPYKLNRHTSRINQVSADEPLVMSTDSSPPDLRLRPKNDLRLVFLPAPTTCVVPFALSFGL